MNSRLVDKMILWSLDTPLWKSARAEACDE